MATWTLQGNSGPVLFRHLFMLALHCGQTCCPSLQVWYCTCVSSEMHTSRLFGGVGSTIPEALVSLAASSPALLAESSGSCCPAEAVGFGSLCPAKVLGCCSPEVFPSDGVPPRSLLLFGCGIKIRVGFGWSPPLPPFLYLKFQSSRSRTTLLVPAAFSFSSYPSFNFTLSPALCLQAICVLWTPKKLCQKEAFLSSLSPIVELLLDNCN